MPLCQERRGVYKNMQYLDQRLVEMHYEMPLNEIIYDFFDTLKAKTKGYASLDYELSEYVPSDLVKVDMLLNGDQVDALSFIAHREKGLRPRAQAVRKAARQHPPASSSKSPYRRPSAARSSRAKRCAPCARTFSPSATAATSRERKSCSKSRRKAKKKMRQLGTVQIPTEAFLAVLKLDE